MVHQCIGVKAVVSVVFRGFQQCAGSFQYADTPQRASLQTPTCCAVGRLNIKQLVANVCCCLCDNTEATGGRPTDGADDGFPGFTSIAFFFFGLFHYTASNSD